MSENLFKYYVSIDYDNKQVIESQADSKEVTTAAMLREMTNKFRGENANFTAKQFEEFRKKFFHGKVEYMLCYPKKGATLYDDAYLHVNETVCKPISLSTLIKNHCVEVSRVEEFEIKTEDGTINCKRNFYRLNFVRIAEYLHDMVVDYRHKLNNAFELDARIEEARNSIAIEQHKLDSLMRIKKSLSEFIDDKDVPSCKYTYLASDMKDEFNSMVDEFISKMDKE